MFILDTINRLTALIKLFLKQLADFKTFYINVYIYFSLNYFIHWAKFYY